jgi:hypothetical protein
MSNSPASFAASFINQQRDGRNHISGFRRWESHWIKLLASGWV